MRQSQGYLLRSHKLRHAVLVLGALIPLVLLTSLVLTGDGYEIDQWAISGGESASRGGTYLLNGTVGQPEAGQMSGGDYVLDGGLEPGDREAEITVLHLPFISN